MKTQNIVIGEFYRHKSSPNYGYLKPLKILKANHIDNDLGFTVVKCEHTVNKNDSVGLIKNIRPSDIVGVSK